MTNKHFYRAIILRLISIVGLTMMVSFLFFAKENFILSLILMLLVIAVVINTIAYFNRTNQWIAFFLLGIENEDTTLKIPKKTGNKAIDEVFKGLHRLNEMFKKTKIEIGTQEQYYRSIINQSATGLFSVNELGRIISINPAAEKLTGLISYHHVNTLERIDSTLPTFIQKTINKKDSSSAIYENKHGQKLLFKISQITTSEKKIKLVVVSDITKELDSREVDAWIKLARTLSHEIMNNIAPITTLSHVILNYFVSDGTSVSAATIKQGTVDNAIKGLQVIEERSTGLLKFVDNYRKFTKLPEPDLKNVDLSKLIKKTLLVCSGLDGYKKVLVEEFLPESLFTVTDDDLLSQVLINLIKNALETYSEENSIDNPIIQIKAKKESNRIKIDICNNGNEIPTELREQIFVPFFTTKDSGSGIGLSLSKQIMIKLGGDIVLKSNSRGFTCFSLYL